MQYEDLERSMLEDAFSGRAKLEEGIMSLLQLKRDSSVQQVLSSYQEKLALDSQQQEVYTVMCAEID